MSKYDQLASYLTAHRRRSVHLTFQQIEQILSTRLPASALKNSGWWNANSAVWVFNG